MANEKPQTANDSTPETPDTEQEETQIEDEGQVEEKAEQPPQEEGQGQEEKKEEGKGDLGKFKNIEERVKGYENLEKSYTKVSQELADTRRLISEIRNNQTYLQRQIPQQQQQIPQEQIDWTDPNKAATVIARQELARAIPVIINQVQQINTAKQLEAVRRQNPVEFERRTLMMAELAKQNPELNDDPNGAFKLYEMAGKEMEKTAAATNPEALAERIAPLIAKKLGITLEDAKNALKTEASQRKTLGGLGGGQSGGPPKSKDPSEDIVSQMEKYR